MIRRDFLRAALAAPVFACGGKNPPPKPAPTITAEVPDAGPAEPPGVKRVAVAQGKHNVWTQRLGEGAVKVLVLHGGPGASHDYLEPLQRLAKEGVEVYFYDQLGCGASDKPDDASLWTVDRYCEEVEEVRQGLGLDAFVLYGHSWGGMLAIEYAIKYGSHLSKLVISNMTASAPSYAAYVAKLRKQLTPETQKKLDALDKAKKYDDPEYEKILMGEVYPKHLLRLPQPWPAAVMKTFEGMNQKIYGLMQGPNEFVINGNFKGWDRWKDLPKITTPSLVIGAKWDEVDPDELKKMSTAMPKAKYALCPNGSHLCMWDDADAYFGALVPFLKS